MPRIRKKTSKRGTTHQREKIKHKAAETRKKRKKEAKNNPQWKSKQKKDPGIPNNFPYKDQILAEVAEARRQAEEAKQRKKELKKAAKAGVEVEGSDDEGSVRYDGTTAMYMATAGSSKENEKTVPAEDEEEEAPALTSCEWPNLKSLLENADVVVEVLDARDPLAGRSEHLEELVRGNKGQKLFLVLNKTDACPREAVSAWASSLRSQYPAIPFRSSSAFLPSAEASTYVKGKGKERADDAWGVEAVTSLLEQWAKEKDSDEPLVVAVAGVTNVGKSSFINSLIRKAALPIYKLSAAQDGPSTTTHAQEVVLELAGKKVRLVDTPGLTWVQSEEAASNTRARDILTRNKGRIERLKDPEPVVDDIVMRASKEDLMLFYNLPAFADKDVNAFLSALARPNGLVKKGGVLDVVGASRIVLRDWSTGKFPRYTTPSSHSTSAMAVDPPISNLYSSDDKILARLSTKKDLRKTTGVVKLTPSEVEGRKIPLEAAWVGVGDDESDEDVDDVDEEVSEDEDDDDDEEEEEEESNEGDKSEDTEDSSEEEADEDDEEEEPAPPMSKRKRGPVAPEPVRPKKKVTFSVEPKSTKQARSKAGANGAAARKARDAATKPKVVAKAAPPKKIANTASSKKVPALARTDEEAYDFKKFF